MSKFNESIALMRRNGEGDNVPKYVVAYILVMIVKTCVLIVFLPIVLLKMALGKIIDAHYVAIGWLINRIYRFTEYDEIYKRLQWKAKTGKLVRKEDA